MKFIIKHQSNSRVRLELPFTCPHPVQMYLEELACTVPGIEKLHFYKDLKHVGVYFTQGKVQQVQRFLSLIQMENVIEKQKEVQWLVASSPYDIISTHLYRRMLSKVLLPTPIRMGWILMKMVKFGKAAFQSICEKKLSMSLLDFVAISTSMAMGDHKTADMIMFLLNLGDDLDDWSQKKSIEELEKNLTNNIYEIWIEKEGERFKKMSNHVEVGDVFVATEGQEIYFDGRVVNGRGYLNESSLTGESFPVSKKIGDMVYANTVVEHGELLVEVTNKQQNLRLQQIVQLIKSSEFHQSKQQKQLMEKADGLVKYNFIGMALTYLFTRSVSKALTFLLVDYSCALKLSSPATYLTAIKAASNQGIVIKGSNSLDEYAQVDTFVFDKTGTITVSRPYIREVLPFYEYSYEEVVKIGACLEEHIYHPIASAVVSKAEEDGIEHEEMHTELYHIASRGIVSHIDGEKVVIGSSQLIKDENILVTVDQERIIAEKQEQYNLLFLGYKGKLISIFCIDIPLRNEANSVLAELRNKGKKVVLLTGDNDVRTNKILKDITFDEVYTNMTPVTKFEYIRKEKEQGRRVLMIGDGLNDSAALSESDISIVMNESADLSKQISDVVLQSDSLDSLLLLSDVSKKLRAQMSSNVKGTVTINSSLIFLGLVNVLSPNLLALLHNLTTFGIVLKNFKIK